MPEHIFCVGITVLASFLVGGALGWDGEMVMMVVMVVMVVMVMVGVVVQLVKWLIFRHEELSSSVCNYVRSQAHCGCQ